MDNKKKEYIKLGIKVGIGLAAIYVVYKVIRKTGARNRVLRQLGDKRVLTTDAKGNLKGTRTEIGFQPEATAKELEKSLKGFGTNINKFQSALEGLSLAQRQEVKNYFDAYLSDGSSLFDWIDAEWGLDSQEKDILKGYFK